MIQWLPYTYVRFSFFLIVGILLGIYIPSLYTPALGLLLVVFVVYLGLYIFYRYKKRAWIQQILGIIGLSSLVWIGIALVAKNDLRQHPHHLSHQDSISFLKGTIISNPNEKQSSYQAIVEVQYYKNNTTWQKASGKVLVYLAKDTSKVKPTYGQGMVWQANHLQPIPTPKNPNMFNYAQYLSYQQIYHQQYIRADAFQFTEGKISPFQKLTKWALGIRAYCYQTLMEQVGSQQEASLAAALTFGIKEHLDTSIKQAYTDAGVTHVLAVSGLHVGLIFMLLRVLLGGIKKVKNGNFIFLLIVLGVLWGYALVTGLSASVMRAATMFSLMQIAQSFRKNTNIYNTLAFSAFLLLCWNPFFIVDVGFQLSYLAVLGIVYFYPKFSLIWTPRHRWIAWAWSATLVSVSAQIATFPITLYYFHQYPTYGLFANLLVIPAGYGILVGGLLTVALSALPALSAVVGFLLKWLVWATNWVVFFIQNIGSSTVEVHITGMEVILLYALIIYILCLFAFRKFSYVIGSLVLVSGLLGFKIHQRWQQSQQQQISIYHIPKASASSIIEGKKALLMSDSAFAENPTAFSFNIKGHLGYLGVKNIEEHYFTEAKQGSMQCFEHFSLLSTQKATWLFLHKKPTTATLQVIQSLAPDYVVVQNKALYQLTDLYHFHQPNCLIVDGSNPDHLHQKLAKEAQKMQINFWSTAQKGAFIRDL